MDRSHGETDPATGKIIPRLRRRVKIVLRDNVPAAMAIARLFSWIVDPPKPEPPSPTEERLRLMTPEQREQDAYELYERARRVLDEDAGRRRQEEEGEVIDQDDDQLQSGGIGQ